MEERYGSEGMCNKRLRWGYTRRIDFNERILGRKFSSKCGAILIIKYFILIQISVTTIGRLPSAIIYYFKVYLVLYPTIRIFFI